ncbi:hypothetical protein GWK47_011307 [Chionoecetes opilio]|uniref:Uncharacterized protein n=1 Tax=Chionoecetes opilio TaxID=41210 RepID=A0A8J4Y305_CHIOP|nr:hypothetical protein GWK47_011307 [Chionoecetes opilio]
MTTCCSTATGDQRGVRLSRQDRRTQPLSFRPSSPSVHYMENQCAGSLEEVRKELDRYKEESSKSHESEGGSHPSVVHRQPAFTYLHCLPHPPQDTSIIKNPSCQFVFHSDFDNFDEYVNDCVVQGLSIDPMGLCYKMSYQDQAKMLEVTRGTGNTDHHKDTILVLGSPLPGNTGGHCQITQVDTAK